MNEIKNASGGTVFQEISKGVFRTISIILPPENLLHEFDVQVDNIFKKIKSNQLQIQKLEQLRDTLLPKLMSGEVRVNYG